MLPGWSTTTMVLPARASPPRASRISRSSCPTLASSRTSPVRPSMAVKWCDHLPTSTPQLMSNSLSIRPPSFVRSWRSATAPATALL